MSKSAKNKKDKVPKITEAEYTAYVLSLKNLSEEKDSVVNVDMGTASMENSPIKEE